MRLMEKKMSIKIIRKSLVVMVILLFIGVAFVPSINFNIVKASNENDLVEVTTEACGIQGYGDTTVKLTREQYQNLERYLIEFRARLNQTKTREEAIPIFKEAVVELNKYGVLPRGMSIEKAEKLVTGEYLNKKMMNTLELFVQKKSVSDEMNFLCLMAGHIFKPIIITPLNIIGIPIFNFGVFLAFFIVFSNLWPAPISESLARCVLLIFLFPYLVLTDISLISPVSILLYSYIEGCNLSTIGLLGMKNFNVNSEHEIFGFIGLKLIVEGFGIQTRDVYLLGFCLYIGPPFLNVNP
jgi:hypothetical protein